MQTPRGLEKSPVYNDQGQLVGMGDTMFPTPADRTALALSLLMAQKSHLKPVPTAQTNRMDEAYNRTLFLQTLPSLVSKNRTNMKSKDKQLQEMLFFLFGGKGSS